MKTNLIVILVLLFTAAVSHAENEEVEDISALFRKYLNNQRVVKCGTPHLISLLNGDTEEAAAFKTAYTHNTRPTMEVFTDSENGHFRVHYDLEGGNAPDPEDNNNNSIPDFVDSTLVYLEIAWQYIVVDLGYGQPKPDGTKGGSMNIIDCYIKNLSKESLYGYTMPDLATGGFTSSYIIIDNDFSDNIYPTKGYDALKITTAHEFFHTIHFSYYSGSDVVWWMEHSAVWMEDQIWDDVNDYFNYLGFIFDNRDLPLDTYSGTFEYGASLFAYHIAKEYGTQMIRTIWKTFRDNQNGKIENLNSVLPHGLSRSISDLAVWLYFTRERSNPEDFFKDSDLFYHTIEPEQVVDGEATVDSLSFKHYTFNYIDIKPRDGFSYGDSLYFSFEDRNGGLWKNQVILYNSSYNYEIEMLSGNNPSIAVPRPFDNAVLVITNVSQLNNTYNYVYSVDTISSKNVEHDPLPVPFVLHQNYPNPFNPLTTITYSIKEESPVTMKVMNTEGQVVATLVNDILKQGSYSTVFDGSYLSSGTYFVVLKAGRSRLTRKMSLVK
ncbi:MXAN_6640 family putative metalloprotease [Candidatus Latescibacterota bacterium]